MGRVYLAEHVKMGRKSAIKVLNPTMVYDPDAVARFNREAANASRITHPNVCAIYDFGETPEGLIYLAMEFIEGEPLTDLLAREGALPPRRAALVCTQVADALQAAHDLGIVHRDLTCASRRGSRRPSTPGSRAAQWTATRPPPSSRTTSRAWSACSAAPASPPHFPQPARTTRPSS